MSEKISTELLKVMNEIVNNETTASKIDASIFIRNSQNLINQKIAYLYNMIKVEAKNCRQNQEYYFDDIELIITHYKQKLNMVYDEFYCQYVNIQNEIQEAKNNRRIAMINYQKLINGQEEKAISGNEDKKETLKKKNETYKQIINKCNLKFEEIEEKFNKMINEEFVISSNSLQIASEQNIFQRLFSKISNIFNGGKKYNDILNEYNKMINNIDSHEIVVQMREDTVNFVADLLEIRGNYEDGLEDVRLGGKYEGRNK